MAREAMGKCPVCGSDTEVTKITCNNCDTTLEGHFHLCKFCKLTNDQRAFIDVFMKCRGNIKEVEKELGVSYPTVKNKLEDAAAALGHKVDPEPVVPGKNKSILDKLNSGEISVEEALEQMKE
jgi:hypothetical protein